MKIRDVELSKADWMTMMDALKTANQNPEFLAKEAIEQNCSPEEVSQHNDRLIADIKEHLESSQE